jgi:hypothetical protein
MNNGQKMVMREICRPDGAGPMRGVLATTMPLLTKLDGINDSRLFYENDVRFLKQF